MMPAAMQVLQRAGLGREEWCVLLRAGGPAAIGGAMAEAARPSASSHLFFPEGLGDLGVVLGGGRSLSGFAFFEVNLKSGGVVIGGGVFINFAYKCGGVQVVGEFLFVDDVVNGFR